MALPERGSINIALRVNLSLVVVACCLCIISFRLWYLQVVNGDYFRDKSENNRLQTVFIPPPRGLIKDRNGEILVTNRPAFNIELIAEDTPDEKKSVLDLAAVVGEDSKLMMSRLRHQTKRRKFEPKLLLKDVSREVIARVVANRQRLPGVVVRVVPARNYLRGEFAAHVLGYIREITQKQLEEPDYSLSMQGDLVGQFGLEEKWERYLQGKRGTQRVIVNATGTRVGELSSESEALGNTLTLTLDAKTQEAADAALADKEGAVVALSPITGEVYAFSSSKRFDPNMFTRGLTPEEWKQLQQGKGLHNKGLQGGYPPGSVYKIFMAVAGLQEGVITPKERVFCPGYYSFAGRDYRCHKKTGHGAVDLESALIQSCDVYFYTVGQRLGIQRIHDWMVRFGLGRLTGIGFPEESPGLIPSPEWKARYHRRQGDKKWYAGETLSVSIGQGANQVTPLQVAVALSAAVNGGTVYQPQLVKSIISNDGRVVEDDFQPRKLNSVDADPKILELVRQAMAGVVNSPRGTGHHAQLDKAFHILVGGKTGTAQVVGLQHGIKGDFNDHAWFAGYAPVEDPKLVVVALIENGGHGGSAAAPVVKQVMEAFFDPTGEIHQKILESQMTAKSAPSGNPQSGTHPTNRVTLTPTPRPDVVDQETEDEVDPEEFPPSTSEDEIGDRNVLDEERTPE